MYRKATAFLAMMFAAALSFASPSYAQTGQAAPAGLSFPINQTGSAGMFDGTLRITSFGVQNNALVASGIVTGTMVNGSGIRTSVARTVTIPVATSTAGATAGKAAPAAAAASCGILHLELGPLDLDVLGLVVHLDKVVLDLSAAPGAGNLLGNLLCSVANLLNASGALSQIAGLLNQILGLLG